jgi:hypothetical protein
MVDAGLLAAYSFLQHFLERHTTAFRIVDSPAGDMTLGEYSGSWPGVIRPLLGWQDGFDAISDGERARGGQSVDAR